MCSESEALRAMSVKARHYSIARIHDSVLRILGHQLFVLSKHVEAGHSTFSYGGNISLWDL